MNKLNRFVAFALAGLFLAGAAQAAAVLVQFDFENGDGGSYLEPRFTDSNVIASDIFVYANELFEHDTAGDTRTDVSFDDTDAGFPEQKWNSIKAKNPNSSNGEDFLSFSLSPKAGLSLNLDCINFMVAKSNENNIGYLMRSNKTTVSISAAVTLISTADEAWEWVMIDLDLIPELQGITDSLVFEIVVDQAAGNVDLRFDKIEVLGTVVPEPSVLLMLGCTLVVVCILRRPQIRI